MDAEREMKGADAGIHKAFHKVKPVTKEDTERETKAER